MLLLKYNHVYFQTRIIPIIIVSMHTHTHIIYISLENINDTRINLNKRDSLLTRREYKGGNVKNFYINFDALIYSHERTWHVRKGQRPEVVRV